MSASGVDKLAGGFSRRNDAARCGLVHAWSFLLFWEVEWCQPEYQDWSLSPRVFLEERTPEEDFDQGSFAHQGQGHNFDSLPQGRYRAAGSTPGYLSSSSSSGVIDGAVGGGGGGGIILFIPGNSLAIRV